MIIKFILVLADVYLSFFTLSQIKKVLEKIKSDFQRYKGEDLKILHDFSDQAYRINTFYTGNEVIYWI